MTPVIPQELWEMIIDYLWYDKAALGSCGLVCRSWLPTSRIHLFSTIRLVASMGTDDLTVLCAPNSTITPYVRYLWIDGDERDGDEWELLPNLLPLFSAVTSLLISEVNWCTLTFEVKDRLHTFSHRLNALKLDNVKFDTLDEPLELISSAPLLEYLQLGSIECLADGVSVADFTAPPLKEIIFGTPEDMPALFYWLCSSATAVRSVTFWEVIPKLIHAISAYLRVLGPALENLTFTVFEWDSETSAILCKALDLAQNPSLRFISFGRLVDYHTPAHDLGWFVDILSQITSPFIERVMIGIALRNLEMLAPLNLSALDALLTGRSTMFSTRLLIRVSGHVDTGEAKMAIRKSLHHLDAQGRLEFDLIF